MREIKPNISATDVSQTDTKPNIEDTDKWEDLREDILAALVFSIRSKQDISKSTDLLVMNIGSLVEQQVSKARIEERNKLIDQIKRKCVAVDGSGKKDTYWEYFIKFLDSLLKEEGDDV